jgi:hypothetical protein
MEAFLASGLVADLALAVLMLEAAALWALRRFGQRGPGLAPLGLGLLSGACLLLALRAALTGAGAAWIGAALAAAGAAQVAWLVQCVATAPSAHAGPRARGQDSPPGPR